MADEETKEAETKPKTPKRSKVFEKKLKEAEVLVAKDQSETQVTTVLRDERGQLMPGSASPGAIKRRGGVAAQIQALFPNIIDFAVDVTTGKVKASREQVTMLKDLMDRRFGRSPETHLVGAMDSEQREAMSALSKEQLLGLLDSGPKAVEQVVSVVEGTVVTMQTT